MGIPSVQMVLPLAEMMGGYARAWARWFEHAGLQLKELLMRPVTQPAATGTDRQSVG